MNLEKSHLRLAGLESLRKAMSGEALSGELHENSRARIGASSQLNRKGTSK